MTEDLPTVFDVIIVGTGLVESIVAGATSRIGKTVLHLDYRDYYGGILGTFYLSKFREVVNQYQQSNESKCAEQEEKILLPWRGVYNFTEYWYIHDDESSALHNEWPKARMLESRQFNLDLLPKVIYSSGDMVDALINSGISRYSEYKTTQLFTLDLEQGTLTKVPCSRADVFNSSSLSMIEKRLLMKTLTAVALNNTNDSLNQENEKLSFGEFLSKHQVQGKVRKHLTEDVAMVTENESFEEAKTKINKFIKSIGRFGETPFLWPVYGSGELPQSFCRCSAVFGGIYILNQLLPKFVWNDNHHVSGITLENKTISAPNILIESSLLKSSPVRAQLSRAILITNKSLTPNCSVALTNIHTASGKSIRLIELSSSSMACPQGLFVLHLITPKIISAKEDLEDTVNCIFSKEVESLNRSNILWCSYFNLDIYGAEKKNNQFGIASSPGPNCDIDMDSSILEAKEIFKQMFPEGEFLPRMPDPEDFIFNSSLDDPKVE